MPCINTFSHPLSMDDCISDDAGHLKYQGISLGCYRSKSDIQPQHRAPSTTVQEPECDTVYPAPHITHQ